MIHFTKFCKINPINRDLKKRKKNSAFSFHTLNQQMKASSHIKSVTNNLHVTWSELTKKAQANSLLLWKDKSLGHHTLTAVGIFLNISLFKIDWLFRGIIYKAR